MGLFSLPSVVRALSFVIVGVMVLGNSLRAQEPQGKKYAVLVGVREYDRNQLRSLPYPENDVQELADLLKQNGFRRVELLTQTEGARQSRYLPLARTIRETLKGVLEDRSKDDLILVAFAGHGVQFKGDKEHYFCPMDAVLTDKSTLISLSDVYRELQQSQAGVKLLIVDACRNDPLAGNSRDGGDVKLESLTRPQLPDPPGGVAALFSCSAGQRAFEDESLKHGVFFHHVLLGLKGEAKVGNRDKVTWDSLIAYVKSEVPDTVKDLFGNSVRQIPEHKGELRGEVTLIGPQGTKPSLTAAKTGVAATPAMSNITAAPQKAVNIDLTKVSLLTSPFDEIDVRVSQKDLAKQLQIEARFENRQGMEMILIPPGEYARGTSEKDLQLILKGDPALNAESLTDEQPQHRVRIATPFYMAKFETTQAQFQRVLGRNNSSHSPTGRYKQAFRDVKTGDFPVEQVTWYDCIEFCNSLSQKEGQSACYELSDVQRDTDRSIKQAKVRIISGTGYRLPSEAEWEYACRAGTKTLFPFGNELDGAKANVNGKLPFGTQVKGPALDRPCSVGTFVPNQFGLYDMTGNVWEWCQDSYEETAYVGLSGKMSINPISLTSAQFRVLRGGSWSNSCSNARSSDRGGFFPEVPNEINGFRVVCGCSVKP